MAAFSLTDEPGDAILDLTTPALTNELSEVEARQAAIDARPGEVHAVVVVPECCCSWLRWVDVVADAASDDSCRVAHRRLVSRVAGPHPGSGREADWSVRRCYQASRP